MLLIENGNLLSWGLNNYGQLGDGSTIERWQPRLAVRISGPIVSITAGLDHPLALNADGEVYSWGANTEGQWGDR